MTCDPNGTVTTKKLTPSGGKVLFAGSLLGTVVNCLLDKIQLADTSSSGRFVRLRDTESGDIAIR